MSLIRSKSELSLTEPKRTYDGMLQLIIGPMFSGKTTELIRIIRRYNVSTFKTLILKYTLDTRYSEKLATHDKIQYEAVPTMKLNDVLETALKYDVIGIDEGQFFTDLFDFVKTLLEYGKRVVIAGLDGNYKQQPFGQILQLIPLADSVKKLRAICVCCNHDASFSHRTTSEEKEQVIGGAESYVAMCRRCLSVVQSGKFDLNEWTRQVHTKKLNRRLAEESSLCLSSLENVPSQIE